MTRKLTLLLMSGFVSGLLGFISPVYATETSATFTIEKMTCAVCPLTVRKAMERVDGVLDAEVNFDSKTATVKYDDERTTPEEIARASTEVGYPASLSDS